MTLLSVRKLSKRFGENVVLENVDADVEKGEIVAIIGPSGSGKSTFLRMLNLLDPPTSGEILLDGERVSARNINAIRRKMGMVFQDFGLFSHLTVLQNLTLGQVSLLKRTKAQAQERALELLKSVGLSERAASYPAELSGGQKQRVAISRALAMDPEIILFDEPTSSLDPTMTGEVTAVIRSLAKTGITMLIVTHEMQFAEDISSRVFYMDEGGIYESGTPQILFREPTREKTRRFINRVRSLEYEITSDEYDFYELIGKIETFCFRNGIDGSTARKLSLVTEELVVATIVPLYGNCTLALSYSEKLGRYELCARYRGANANAVKVADELSAMIIQNSAKEITHTYAAGENVLRIVL
ncbi:MAG: amino acid ABC transporter ATP-binding protein [Coriobacteriales bacterium]|jgi:polar amino acid transport system ATP-binding protein|nr:amino acid ABC transporter ATP-binding protein [Coriobacteriales bacterium]